MKTIAKVVRALDAQPMTIDQIAEATGVARRAVERELRWLRENKLVKVVGKARAPTGHGIKQWGLSA